MKNPSAIPTANASIPTRTYNIQFPPSCCLPYISLLNKTKLDNISFYLDVFSFFNRFQPTATLMFEVNCQEGCLAFTEHFKKGCFCIIATMCFDCNHFLKYI